MQPQNTPDSNAPVDRTVPFSEKTELLPDEELFRLSDSLIYTNYDAYRELAK